MAGQLKVTQIRSGIGRPKRHKQTLLGLGLKRRGRTVIVPDTPQMRGMLETVKHLVEWEEV